MSLNRTESLRQAELLAQQGNFAGAIGIYNKLLTDNPFDLICVSAIGDLYVKKDSVQKAIEYFFQTADHYWKKGSINSVIYVLKKIVKLDPANIISYVKLGDLYLREGEKEKAHNHFIEAGALLSQQSNFRAAMEVTKKALMAKPDSPQAQTACAALQEEMNPRKPEPAPMMNNQAVEPIYISLSEVEAQTVETPTESEDSEEEKEYASLPADVKLLQNYDEPVVSPNLQADMDDKTVIKKISVAEMQVGYGEIDEAIASLKEVLWSRPDFLDARVRLKDVYLRAGMLDRASEECVNIAGLYAALGDAARAKDYLVRAKLIASRKTA